MIMGSFGRIVAKTARDHESTNHRRARMFMQPTRSPRASARLCAPPGCAPLPGPRAAGQPDPPLDNPSRPEFRSRLESYPRIRSQDQSGLRRPAMELDLGPEIEQIRRELRDWIAEHAPPALAGLAYGLRLIPRPLWRRIAR